VALAGASRAVAVAAALTDEEVTDGGGWKRNEWWGDVRVRWWDKIVNGTHLRFFLTASQLIRPERRASSGRPFVSISVCVYIYRYTYISAYLLFEIE
jgi:hypothetical protein